MAETRIQICGRVVAEVGGRRVEGELPGRQGRVLFVYLVVNRLRPAPRDELTDAVWPEGPPANVDSALSALLSKLRKLIQLEGRRDVRALLPADAWIDLDAAREALHRAESSVARGAWHDAWGPVRVAQHVSARGFLPGESAPWIETIRHSLEGIELRSLELAASACLQIGGSELDTAERSARGLVSKAPFRESGHRLLMEILAARANRAEALQVYERLRLLLREELGAAPSPETQQLHRTLLG